MTERLDFVTPIGRYVSGDLLNKRTQDSDNRPIAEDKQRFEFGVAFPKGDIWPLLTQQFYSWIASKAQHDQNAMNRLTNWFTTLSGFSMKISDGDKPNQRGQYNENTKGCLVMWFSSTFAPQTVDPTNQNIAAETVKRGFYVQIAGNIAPNGDRNSAFQAGDRAGIYLNANFVRLVAEGDEIRTGPSAGEAFGDAAVPTALPPGARPLGSSSGAAGAFGGVSGNLPTPGGAPAPAQMAPVAPQPAQAPAPQSFTAPQPTAAPGSAAAPQPHYGIMQPQPTVAAAPGAFVPPPLPGQG